GTRYYLPAQLHIAVNKERLDKLDESTALLDKISDKYPNRYETLTVKGDLLRMHGKFAAAVAAYTKALSRLPKLEKEHWVILFARGVCVERQGKWVMAEKDLEQALQLNPAQSEVVNYLVYSWLTRNERIQEAHDMLETAVAKRPNDAQIVDSMGWAMYLLGHYDQAATYIEKALELIPSDPTVNDHLGDVYWRQGRRTEARFQWERSLYYSPEEELTKTIHKK